jgi:hypothetical protein
LLDETADNKLVEAFGPWPTLIDLPRQRGKHPPVTVGDDDGNKYRVEADGRRTIARPSYKVTEIEEGRLVEIAAPIQKQADQLIGRLVKEFPQVNAEDARANARTVSQVLNKPWHISTNFAPNQVFPGIFAALWLFHIHTTSSPFCSWDVLKAELKDGVLASRMRYFPDGLPGLTGPDLRISHKLVLRSDPSKRILVGYAEILGVLRVGGVLADRYDGQAEKIYVSEVMAKVDRSDEFVISEECFRQVDWAVQGLDFFADRQEITRRLTDASGVLRAAFDDRERSAPASEIDSAEDGPADDLDGNA